MSNSLLIHIFRENPAITHRLIPWLNRELVVLIPQNTDAIPRILEEMREMLCVHDIQSREVHNYFQTHLHHRTGHFIHEFLSKLSIMRLLQNFKFILISI